MINSFDDLRYRVKRLTNSDRLVMATVRPDEEAQSVSSPQNAEATELIARAMGYVDICARRNAEAVSSNPLILYRPRTGSGGRSVSRRAAKYLTGDAGVMRTKQNIMVAAEDDDFEIVDNHESVTIMERPNRWVRSGTDYRFAQQYAKELSGNSYGAWVAGEGALYTLNPAFVSILPDEDGDELICGYAYGRDTSAPMLLLPDEILHGTLFTDFRQPYYGVSWLNAIIDSADLWIATEAYLRKTMRSSGRPDLLIHFEGQYNSEQFERTKTSFYARIRQIMRGGKRSDDKGNIIVTGEHEGRPTAIPLGTPPKDMASVEIANDTERTIGNAAGIPETIYRMSDSNLASARTGEMTWKRDTIMPRCIREAEEMTEWLHANWPEAKDGGWFFAPENCVPTDREADERVALSGWQSGLVRRNEARVVLGYDPIEGRQGEELLDLQPAAQEAQSDPLFGLFGSPRPARTEPTQPSKPQGEGEVAAENLAEGEKLNGAQIEAALLILQRITEGTLARGAAIELLVALGIDRQRAVSMVDENRRDAEPPSEEEVPVKSHDPGDESDHEEAAKKEDETNGDAKKECDPSCSHDAKVWSQADAYAKTPDTLTGDGEREFAELREVYAGIVNVFDEQRKAVLGAMEDAPMGLKGSNPRRYAVKQFESFFDQWGITDVEKWAAAMSAATGEAIRREFAKRAIESLQLVYDEAPDEFRAEMPDPATINPDEWIIQDNRAAVITRRFADRYEESMLAASRTTAERLANTLSEGLEGGESLAELQDRVQVSFLEGDGVTVSESRAAKIARTEVAQAQTEGRIAGMAGSRVVKGYRFNKAVSACPICDAVEAEVGDRVFGVEEAMFPKGSSIQATDGRTYKFDYQDTIVPVHPNCRCSVRSVLIDL
jgi:phage portal protein BeeE